MALGTKIKYLILLNLLVDSYQIYTVANIPAVDSETGQLSMPSDFIRFLAEMFNTAEVKRRSTLPNALHLYSPSVATAIPDEYLLFDL